MTADLTHIDTWLFDLDYTLYPHDCEVMALVDARMDAYVERMTGLTGQAAKEARHQYFLDHGTTLAGLRAHFNVDPAHFIAEVQDIGMDSVLPDPVLRGALQRLQGRRLVFTNAGGHYAERVLEKLGIADLFEDVFHIEAADYIPKPQRSTFEKMIARHGVTAKSAIFFEDSERNLQPAAELGMTTVLVGPHAIESSASFVHHRTATVAAFLNGARVNEE